MIQWLIFAMSSASCPPATKISNKLSLKTFETHIYQLFFVSQCLLPVAVRIISTPKRTLSRQQADSCGHVDHHIPRIQRLSTDLNDLVVLVHFFLHLRDFQFVPVRILENNTGFSAFHFADSRQYSQKDTITVAFGSLTLFSFLTHLALSQLVNALS